MRYNTSSASFHLFKQKAAADLAQEEDDLQRSNIGAGGDHVNRNRAGNLFGISFSGGLYGAGALYELMPSQGGWTEKVLYSFTGGNDGSRPVSLLVGRDGNLYGLTWAGGANGDGVIFQLVPSAGTWTENVLYTFTGGSDGYDPLALVQDSAGNLYGNSIHDECIQGYCAYFGLIFELSRRSSNWSFTVLYDTAWFDDEYDVFNGMATDSGGNVYGTGGSAYPLFSSAYVFELVNNWPSDLVSFYSGDGVHSIDVFGNLTLDASGNIYGTTPYCGIYNKGTVWKLTH